MASDEISVSHALGILDQYSFRSIDRAVQQFKDLGNEVYETLADMRSSGQRLCLNSAVVPLVKGSAGLGSNPGKKKFEDVGSVLHVVDEDIENPRGRAYALRSRTAQKPCNPMCLQSVRKFHAKKVTNVQGELVGAIETPNSMHSQLLTITDLKESQRETIEAIGVPHMMEFSYPMKEGFRKNQGDSIGSFPNVVDKDIENSTGRVLRSRTAKKPCNSMTLRRSRRCQMQTSIEPETIEDQGGSAEALHMMHFQTDTKTNIRESQEESTGAVVIPHMKGFSHAVKQEFEDAPEDAIGTLSLVVDKDIENLRGREYGPRFRTAKKPFTSKPTQRVTRSCAEKAIKIEPIEPEEKFSRAIESPHMIHSQLVMESTNKESEVESVGAIEISNIIGFPYSVKKEFKEVQGEVIQDRKTHCNMSITAEVNELRRGTDMISQKTSLLPDRSQKEEHTAKKAACIQSDGVIKRVHKESRGEAMGARVITPHRIHSEKVSFLEEESQHEAMGTKVITHMLHSQTTSLAAEEVLGERSSVEAFGVRETPLLVNSQKASFVADESLGERSPKEITLANEDLHMILSQKAIKIEPRETIRESQIMLSKGSYPQVEGSRSRKTLCMMHCQEAISTESSQTGAIENRKATPHLEHSQKDSMLAEGSRKEVTEVREIPLMLKGEVVEILTEPILERKAPHITHSGNSSFLANMVIENEGQVNESPHILRCLHSPAETLRFSSVSGPSEALHVTSISSNLKVSEMGILQTELSSEIESLEKLTFEKVHSDEVIKDVLRAEETKDVHRLSNSVLELTDSKHFLSKEDVQVSYSKKNHAGKFEVRPLVRKNPLQNPGDNFTSLKLSNETQTPCLLSGRKESAISVSNHIQDFSSPVKVLCPRVIKQDLDNLEEKIVENRQHPVSLGTKESSANIQPEGRGTCLHVDNPQPHPVVPEPSAHILTHESIIQTYNRVNRTPPSLLGKRQLLFKSLTCGSSKKNHKIWHVSDSVDSQTMNAERVNISTSKKSTSEELEDVHKFNGTMDIYPSNHLSVMHSDIDLTQSDKERECVSISGNNLKNSSPNPGYFFSSPELNDARTASSGLQLRSLMDKDSCEDSSIKCNTLKLNDAKRTTHIVLKKEETPAYGTVTHVGSASNHKSRSVLARIKTAIKGIRAKEITPHIKLPYKSSSVGVSGNKSKRVRKTSLTMKSKVRKFQAETMVESMTPHILDSQDASLLAQGAMRYEDLTHITSQLKDSSDKLTCPMSAAEVLTNLPVLTPSKNLSETIRLSNLKVCEIDFPQTMEMFSQIESLKDSRLEKGDCRGIVKSVLRAEERKDVCQLSNFAHNLTEGCQSSLRKGNNISSRMNRGELELSPMVPNDSLQESGNKCNTQTLKREIQTSYLLAVKREFSLQQDFAYGESTMGSSDGIGNIPITMKKACSDNCQLQSSLGTEDSTFHESRQSAFTNLVTLMESVNTSTFRKSVAEKLKDDHQSSETGTIHQLSDSSKVYPIHQRLQSEEQNDLCEAKEGIYVAFSDKNHMSNLHSDLLPSEASSPNPANTSGAVEFDGTGPLSLSKEQLLAYHGVPFGKSGSSPESCLRSPFTAACLERADTFLQTYLEELGGKSIDMIETLGKKHAQQGIQKTVEYETSKMENNIVCVIPEEEQFAGLSDDLVEAVSARCTPRESMDDVTLEIPLPVERMETSGLRQNSVSRMIGSILRLEEVDNFHNMNGSRKAEDVYNIRDSNLDNSTETEDNQYQRDSTGPTCELRETEDTHNLTEFRDMKEIKTLKNSSEKKRALQYNFMQEGPDKDSFRFSPLILKDQPQNSAMKPSTQRLQDANTALDLVSQNKENHASQTIAPVLSTSNYNHRGDRLKNSAEMEAFRFDNDERSLSPHSLGKNVRLSSKEETVSPESSGRSVGQNIEKSAPMDTGALKFNMLLAQGTVNSSRRKRARSPSGCSPGSFKKMKLAMSGNEEQNCLKNLSEVYMPFPVPRPSFEEVENPYCSRSPFSPLEKFLRRNALGFDSSQKQAKGKDKIYQSYSGASGLGRDYLDTPKFRRARSDFDYSCGMPRMQKSDLQAHVEEDESESENLDNSWSIAKICDKTGSLLEKQDQSDYSSVVKSSHKRYNLASVTSSFLDLQRQKQAQPTLPYANGKREVRVKALEAAENAKRQEEKREYERRQRRMDGHEMNGTMSESMKETGMGLKCVTEKVKRAADVKMKIDQEKARKQEEERRKKEEERRKKELELADRKRKREDADKREREEKRKRVEEMQKLKKEQEERQRLELDAKENRRKMLEDKERKRKAQEEEAKRQKRMEKEKEAERRRKQEESLKAARYAEKQADRKRKEAVLLQPRAHDDDQHSTSYCQRKFSELSTESFSMTSSVDWDVQSKHILLPIINQPTESRRAPSIPRIGSGICPQIYGGKLSASCDENASHILAKKSIMETNSMSQLSKSSNTQCSSPVALSKRSESELLSYEISPYKSSDDEDEDDDDNLKRPVPSWTWKENLVPHIVRQQYIDPDKIFSSERTCNLQEIFGTAGSKNCLNFKQRGTSGDWLSDNLTLKEEIDYKRAMGYINP